MGEQESSFALEHTNLRTVDAGMRHRPLGTTSGKQITQDGSVAARREIASPLISSRPAAHVRRACIATRSKTSCDGRMVPVRRMPFSWKRYRREAKTANGSEASPNRSPKPWVETTLPAPQSCPESLLGL